MRLRFIHAAALTALAFVTVPKRAAAQAWLEDRAYAEGMGIKAGEWEIHPGVAGEFGYDSNFFQRSGTDGLPNERVIDVLRLRLTPSLSATTYGRRDQGPPPKLAFTGTSSLSYNELFPMDDQDAGEIRKNRHLAGGVGGTLGILPKRPWGGDISANYRRNFEPSNFVDTDRAWNRHVVSGGAGIKWQPGGGLFLWRLGYRLRATFFEDNEFEHLNNINHGVETNARWTFLPRTALLYQGQVGFINYGNDPQTQNDGRYVRSRIGMNGLVTNHFGLMGAIGWGSTFYESRGAAPAQNFDSVIAQAEASWYLTPQRNVSQKSARVGLSSISAGYLRRFGDSYFGEFYQTDRGYAKIVYLAASKVVLSLEGGFTHITRPQPVFPSGNAQTVVIDGEPQTNGFSENRADAQLFAEYRPSNTIGINTTFRYDTQLTDTCVHIAEGDPAAQCGASPAGSVDRLDYSRFRAFLGVRWFL